MNSPFITLRPVSAADLPIFYRYQLEPEAVQMAAFPSRSHEAFMAHWEKIMAQQGPVLRTIDFQGEIAGSVVAWQRDGEWNIGYWIGREYWNQGIATAALRAFVAEIAHRPLSARVSANNAGSIRVLEKCGFIAVGTEEHVSADGPPMKEFIFTLGAI